MQYFPVRARRLRRDQSAVVLEHLAPLLSSPDREVRRLASALADQVDASTASRGNWRFIMIDPHRYSEVLNHLLKTCPRPIVAAGFWALVFTAVAGADGRISLSRRELAERLGVAPRVVSEIVSELVKIGAMQRVRAGVEVVYFINPNIVTHVGGQKRDKVQATWPDHLKVVEGGASVAAGPERGVRRRWPGLIGDLVL